MSDSFRCLMFVAAIGCATIVSATANADEPRIVFVELQQVLSAPPRNPDQKYYFTAKHFPTDGKSAIQISIGNAVLDDACFRLISEHSELRMVTLQEVNLSDAELALILSGIDCEHLNVMSTNLTNASVPVLAREKSLKSVHIWNTAITHEGVKRLKELRPDLKINP